MPIVDLYSPDVPEPRVSPPPGLAVTPDPTEVWPQIQVGDWRPFDPVDRIGGLYRARQGSFIPGADDIERGSDAANDRPAWSSNMSWGDVAQEAALGLFVSPVLGSARAIKRAGA